jgi:small-conductance mechanosensitive channel
MHLRLSAAPAVLVEGLNVLVTQPSLAASLLLQALPQNPVDVLSRISGLKILYAILVLAVTYLAVRLSTAALASLGRHAARARFFFNILLPTVRFALWIIGGYVVLAVFAPSQQAMFAVIASVGIALGLGAQDLVKNVIGGLVILMDRPYRLGDRVRIGDAYGEIDHIGLRSTKLTTPDDTRVTIPNSEVLTGMAWNANSGVPDCQVTTELFLPHDTDPVRALEIGYEAAYSSPYLLLSKPVRVLFKDCYSESPYVQLRIKAYVYDHRFETRFQSDVTVRAKSEFLKQGMLKGWVAGG